MSEDKNKDWTNDSEEVNMDWADESETAEAQAELERREAEVQENAPADSKTEVSKKVGTGKPRGGRSGDSRNSGRGGRGRSTRGGGHGGRDGRPSQSKGTSTSVLMTSFPDIYKEDDVRKFFTTCVKEPSKNLRLKGLKFSLLTESHVALSSLRLPKLSRRLLRLTRPSLTRWRL